MIDPITGLQQAKAKPMTTAPVNIPGTNNSPTQGYTLPDRLDRYDFQFTPGIDMNEQRAQTQSNLGLKALGRLTTGAGFEMAKTVPYIGGALMALGAAAVGAENPISYMVDNKLLNWIESGQDHFNEDVMPIYQTMAANGALTDRLFEPSFWATQGADAGAFFLSMILPGRLAAGAGVGSALVKGVGKGSKALKPTFQTSAAAMKTADDFVGTLVNTVAESAAEASHFYKDTRDQLMANGMSEDEANQVAGGNAAGVFGMNMGVLMLSNIAFDALLFKSFDQAFNIGTKKLGSQLGDVANLKDAPLRTGLLKAATAKAALGVASEGFYEEGMQYSIEKYFDARAKNLTDDGVLEGVFSEYFSRIATDADMQTGIFLGSVLGGGAAAVGGVTGELSERSRWEGTSGQDPNGLSARLKKKMGLQPKKANKGLRQLIADNYIHHTKSVSDLYKRNSNGELIDIKGDVIKSGEQSPVIDQDKLSELDLKTKGLMSQLFNIQEALENGDKEAYELQKSFLDLNFMLPYFDVPGGMEVLEQHIQQRADQQSEQALEANPDAITTPKAEAQQLIADAKEYKKMYDRINNTHRVNFAVRTPDGKVDTSEKAQQFSNLVYEVKLTNAVKEYGYDKAIKSMSAQLSDLNENTAEGQANITKLEGKLETLKKSREKLTKQGLKIYDNKHTRSLYNNYANNEPVVSELEMYDVFEDEEGKVFELINKRHDPLYQSVSFDLVDPDTGSVKNVKDISKYTKLGNSASGKDSREEKDVSDEELKALIDEYTEVLASGDALAAADFYNDKVADNKIRLPKEKVNEFFNLISTHLDSMDNFRDMIEYIDKIKEKSKSHFFKKKLDKLRDSKIQDMQDQRSSQIKALDDLINTKQEQREALEESIKSIEDSIEEATKDLDLLASTSRAEIRTLHNTTKLDKRKKEFKSKITAIEESFREKMEIVKAKIEDLSKTADENRKVIKTIEEDILETENFKKWLEAKDTYSKLKEFADKAKEEHHVRTKLQEDLGEAADIDDIFNKDFLEKAVAEQREIVEETEKAVKQLSDELEELNKKFYDTIDEYLTAVDDITAEELQDKLETIIEIVERVEAHADQMRKGPYQKLTALTTMLNNAKEIDKLNRLVANLSKFTKDITDNINSRRKTVKAENTETVVVNTLEAKESAKRGYLTMFTGLAGQHYDWNDNLSPHDSQRRYYYFMQTQNPKNYNVQIVREQDYPDLFTKEQREGLAKAPESVTKHEVLFAILTNKQGELVDMNGNPLADQNKIDPAQAVYTSLTVPKVNEDGSNDYAEDIHKKEGIDPSQHAVNIKDQIDWYTQIRESIIEDLKDGKGVMVPLVGKGRGIRVIDKDPSGNPINHPVSELGIDVFADNTEVFIPVNDQTSQDGVVITGLEGMLFIRDQYNNFHRGYVRNLKEDEITTSYELLKRLAGGDTYSTEIVSGITIKEALQSLMYFGYNKDGESPIYVNKNKDGTQTLTMDGDKIPFMLDSQGELVNQSMIKEFLAKRYINPKSSIINSVNNTGPYRQVEYLNGEFKTKDFDDYENNKLNYLDYLFSGEDPIVQIPTPVMDGKVETVQFINQYGIMDLSAYADKSGKPKQPNFVLSPKKTIVDSVQLDKVTETLTKLIPSGKVLTSSAVGGDFFTNPKSSGQIMVVVDPNGDVLLYDKAEKSLNVYEFNAFTGAMMPVLLVSGDTLVIDLNEGLEAFNTAKKDGSVVAFLKQEDAPKTAKSSNTPAKNNMAQQMAAKKAQRAQGKTAQAKPTKTTTAKAASPKGKSNMAAQMAARKAAKAKKPTPSKKKGRSGPKLRLADTQITKLEDMPQMVKWFRDKYPHVPINVAKELIDNKAWGQFVDNAVTVYNFAAEGTVYHEAFHVVFNLYMSPKERQELIDSYRNQHGELSDLEVEERLADEFMDYMLTGSLSDVKIIKQKSFFRRLWSMIKNLFSGKSVKEQYDVRDLSDIFEDIKYKTYDSKPKYDYQGAVKYRSLGNLTESQTNDLMRGLTFLFFDELAYEVDEGSLMSRLIQGDRIEDSTMPGLFDSYNEDNLLQRARVLAADQEENYYANDEEVNQNLTTLLDGIIENYSEEALELVRERLGKLGINVELQQEDLIEEEQTIGYSADVSYDQLSIEISGKSTASSILKKFLSSFSRKDKEGNYYKNSLGMYEPIDFGKIYSLMANKLANLDSLESMLEFVKEHDGELAGMYDQITARLRLSEGTNMSAEDMITAMQFFQAFSKQRINYDLTLRGYNEEGPIYNTINASEDFADKQIKRRWYENAHLNDIYLVGDENQFVYNVAKLQPAMDAMKSGGASDYYNFAKKLGITLTNFERHPELLSTGIKTRLGFIKKQIENGTLTNLFDIETESSQNLQAMIDLEKTTAVDHFENQHFNAEGKTVYDISLNTYLSIIINKINKVNSEQELLKELPFYNDKYLQNSLVFSKIFKKDGNRGITLINHEAVKSENGNLSKMFKDLNKAEKFDMLVNDTLNGKFHMLRPADNSLERTMDFGGLFVQDVLSSGVISEEVIQIMIGYLSDELQTNHEDAYSNFTKKSVTNPLTIFDFLQDEARGQAEQAIKELDENPDTDMSALLSTPEIKENIESFLENEIAKNIELFERYKFIDKTRSGYNNVSLGVNKKTLSDEEVRNLAANFTVNFAIANIEQTKLFTGHPAFYKSLADFFKRTSALVGTKKLTDHSTMTNEWINTNLVRQDKKKSDGIMKTYVVDDIEFQTKNLSLPDKESYSGDESDAAGLITLDAYREFLFRSGDWLPQMEVVYQWEIGNTMIDNSSPFHSLRGQLIDETLLGSGKYVLPPLKPQYFGPMETGDTFVPGMYKLALTPLTPSMIRSRNLEKINEEMKSKGVDIKTFKSANKVGRKELSTGGTPKLYNEKGELNEINPDGIQSSRYDYWGIQVDNAPKRKSKSPEGSQQQKLHKTDLYERGSAVNFIANKYNYDVASNSFKITKYDPKTAAEYLDKEYNRLNAAKIALGVQSLKRRIGLTDQETDIDYTKVVESLKREAVDRDLPDNVIESIEALTLGLGVETSPAKEKLENVLFAIADSETISRKRFGSGLVQAAVTGFESGNRSTHAKGFESSDELGFYTSDKGVITSMEVYLPNIFKDKLFKNVDINTVDKRLLELVGFRIPTQGLSSIEHIVIKGFLPAHVGDIIVMPSEIVVKNGSDFDFDKMFALFANYTWQDGKPVYTEYIEDPKDFDKLFQSRKNDIIREFGLDKGSLAYQYDRLSAYTNSLKEAEFSIQNMKIVKKVFKSLAQKGSAQALVDNLQEIAVIEQALKDLDIFFDTLSDEEFDAKLEEYETNNYSQERINNLKSQNRQIEEVLSMGVQVSDIKTLNLEAKQMFDKALVDKALIKLEIKNVKKELEEDARIKFDSLSTPMKNGIKAIENRMNEIQKEIILAPQNFKKLTAPLVDSDVKKEAYRIRWILEGSELDFDTWYKNFKEDAVYSKIISADYIADLQEQFLNANAGIGISALQQTNHILAQQHDLYINKSFLNNKGETIDTTLKLEHNKDENDNISLGFINNKEGVAISELLNQMTSAYVDAAKDPFVFLLNAGTETAGTFMYLLRAGVPIRQLVLFMNQPAIKDYLATRSVYESIYWDRYAASDKSMRKSRDSIITEVANKYAASMSQDAKVDNKTLETAIRDRDSLTAAQNRDQVSYLMDFLRYQDTAKALTDAITASTYDTRGFGKNANSLFLLLKSSMTAIQQNSVGNFKEMLTAPDSYLSPYHATAQELIDTFEDYIITINHPGVKDDLVYLISVMAQAGKGRNQIIKVLDRYKSELITFTLQRNPKISSRAGELFTGSKSLPKRFLKVKKMAERNGEENPLFDYLDVIIGEETDHIKPRSGARVDVYLANELTAGWNQLLQDFPEIGNDLADFVILQSGMTRSPMNFMEFMPHRLFQEKIEPYLGTSLSVESFYEKFKTDATMVKDNDITPDRTFNKAHAKLENITKSSKRVRSDLTGRVLSETTTVHHKNDKLEPRGISDFRANRQLKDYSSPGVVNYERANYNGDYLIEENKIVTEASIQASGTEAGEVSAAFVLANNANSLVKYLNEKNIDPEQLTIVDFDQATPAAQDKIESMLLEISQC